MYTADGMYHQLRSNNNSCLNPTSYLGPELLSVARWHGDYISNVVLCAIMQQRVQLQLKTSEKADKDDASPVTIADYGEHSGRSAHCSVYMWPAATVTLSCTSATNTHAAAWLRCRRPGVGVMEPAAGLPQCAPADGC